MNPYYKEISSTVGPLTLFAKDNALIAILWQNRKIAKMHSHPPIPMSNHPLLLETERQLQEYFTHQRTSFSLPIALIGTPFQKTVWLALQSIPYGKTISYKNLAEQIGKPLAARAVGGAVNKNPLAILLPCHRVIGANGALTGFAGGLPIKQKLLQGERQ